MVLLYTLVQWLKGLGVMSPTQHRKKQMEWRELRNIERKETQK
jgi:hypothetical protein